jgi:hypothetical protein
VELHIRPHGDEPLAGLAPLARDLREVPGLVARIRTVSGPPDPGRLGTGLDLLAVALGAGGSLTVLVTEIGRWLRRSSDLDLDISVPGRGRTTISARRVRPLTAQELSAEIDRITRQLLDGRPSTTADEGTADEADPALGGEPEAAPEDGGDAR